MSDNIGWKALFTENSEEFHNLLLKWEKGEETTVPFWLTGVFVRNGPAQVYKTYFKKDGKVLLSLNVYNTYN